MREIIIRPKRIFSYSDIEEIWRSRDLFYTLVWRDIKVRYKQTILGIAWVVLQPLASMIIFTVLFGNLAKIPSGNLPYSLFVFIGLIFWTFFSSSLSHANDSLVANENIIKRVYFPKIILPLSSLVTNFVDFTINTVLLISIAIILGYIPRINFFIIYPFAILLTGITVTGLGLLLSSLNVKYRDVRYVLPFMVQLLFYVTPVIYPLSIMAERNRYIIALNPMTTVIEFVRLIFNSQSVINPLIFLISLTSALVLLLIGLWYFRKTEQFIADVV